ncbi:MerR family transcriptional regulator [Mycolicibacter terrae]|uniref:MerR family transcriptional regulator n=1 Tax=Mycolicibacter terrae TaxID=1788 RepID=A0AAD1HWN2_9MYCO|nr:helix-turn-helix transcriptional regulator [Mycolicibacter terrae]ORW97485.1 MerR family transcriptional regulator [Mycolicibacter terrae]BBX22629.1 MerR family transcriptional regulator [Mycolicibacter terrae]SNV73488.1 molybdenum binding protein [Mycolicibacter terrae]
MPSFRIAEVAELLGVSDDTVRRWIDSGRLSATSGAGPRMVDGAELAAFAQERASVEPVSRNPVVGQSARNRLVGLVTNVTRDTVMAQVDVQAGPFRLVSLVSREAADELRLQPGSLVVASVKATNVVLELPRRAGSAGHTDPAAEFG